jgi:tetratricopeptide (TPR) repeat protein
VVRELTDADRFAAAPAALDEETAERLGSLGYATGSDDAVQPADAGREMTLRGNDPKDLVDVSMGAREIQNGFMERGERKLLRFFRTARSPEEDAAMARLWAAARLNYGKIWLERGELARAAEQYAEAVRVDPDYAPARWLWIWTLNRAGRPERAEAEAERLLARYPNAWRVRLHRGLALALTGRDGEARRELETVAESEDAPEEVARSARYYLGHLGEPDESVVLGEYLRAAS